MINKIAKIYLTACIICLTILLVLKEIGVTDYLPAIIIIQIFLTNILLIETRKRDTTLSNQVRDAYYMLGYCNGCKEQQED